MGDHRDDRVGPIAHLAADADVGLHGVAGVLVDPARVIIDAVGKQRLRTICGEAPLVDDLGAAVGVHAGDLHSHHLRHLRESIR
jgi:hypothetical protein